MTTETETRGFPGLPCFACDETDTMRLNLSDMSLMCTNCEKDFDPAELRQMFAEWTRVLDWIETAPVVK